MLYRIFIILLMIWGCFSCRKKETETILPNNLSIQINCPEYLRGEQNLQLQLENTEEQDVIINEIQISYHGQVISNAFHFNHGVYLIPFNSLKLEDGWKELLIQANTVSPFHTKKISKTIKVFIDNYLPTVIVEKGFVDHQNTSTITKNDIGTSKVTDYQSTGYLFFTDTLGNQIGDFYNVETIEGDTLHVMIPDGLTSTQFVRHFCWVYQQDYYYQAHDLSYDQSQQRKVYDIQSKYIDSKSETNLQLQLSKEEANRNKQEHIYVSLPTKIMEAQPYLSQHYVDRDYDGMQTILKFEKFSSEDIQNLLIEQADHSYVYLAFHHLMSNDTITVTKQDFRTDYRFFEKDRDTPTSKFAVYDIYTLPNKKVKRYAEKKFLLEDNTDYYVGYYLLNNSSSIQNCVSVAIHNDKQIATSYRETYHTTYLSKAISPYQEDNIEYSFSKEHFVMQHTFKKDQTQNYFENYYYGQTKNGLEIYGYFTIESGKELNFKFKNIEGLKKLEDPMLHQIYTNKVGSPYCMVRFSSVDDFIRLRLKQHQNPVYKENELFKKTLRKNFIKN
ncbi:hypothetical protein [Flammeovirga sp. SubArs3]|uniref:hypothetical protein n=1 Tax=Flammeovirga sp. SubArs3 TaxID=2995316 RepID=UPI00248CCA9D|nr:hypothetical protein [Flammeovirga sp. SubArs3]